MNGHERRRGYVEHPYGTYAHIRDAETWDRYFVAGADMHAGSGIPPEGAEVEFTPDFTDTRGPRGRQVALVSDDPPPAIRLCIGCRAEFSLKQTQLAWFRAKRLEPPRRCPSCRAEKRARRTEAEGIRANR